MTATQPHLNDLTFIFPCETGCPVARRCASYACIAANPAAAASPWILH